ncbi:MAG: hypothetical protein ACM30G_14725 [Micromonosporaceae bacterium]
MRRIVALAAAALTLAGTLATTACTPRAGRTGGASTSEQGGAPPAPAAGLGSGGGIDSGAADRDLSSVDSLLTGVDAELANADKTPEDAD